MRISAGVTPRIREVFVDTDEQLVLAGSVIQRPSIGRWRRSVQNGRMAVFWSLVELLAIARRRRRFHPFHLEVSLKEEQAIPVFRHQKRSEWGAALLTWERDGKRGYLFEDGMHRMIADSHQHFMTPVHLEQEELSAAFREQISQMSLANADNVLSKTRGISAVFSFDEQAQLLQGQFPEGFAGEKWRKRHRGMDAKKRLKRHRQPAVEDASKVFTHKRLADAVAENRHEPLWSSICELLEGTDLVPPKDVKALRQRVSRVDRGATLALASLLDSPPAATATDEFGHHFTALVTELKKLLGTTPSWPLVTSFLALSSPSDHFCVHPKSLGYQRRWLRESAISSRKPNIIDYRKALQTATDLRAQLEQSELAPADLLDVYDFIRTLTLPSAMKRLEALRQANIKRVEAAPQNAPATESASEGTDTAAHATATHTTAAPASEPAANDETQEAA